jgi:hypothetical protein
MTRPPRARITIEPPSTEAINRPSCEITGSPSPPVGDGSLCRADPSGRIENTACSNRASVRENTISPAGAAAVAGNTSASEPSTASTRGRMPIA